MKTKMEQAISRKSAAKTQKVRQLKHVAPDLHAIVKRKCEQFGTYACGLSWATKPADLQAYVTGRSVKPASEFLARLNEHGIPSDTELRSLVPRLFAAFYVCSSKQDPAAFAERVRSLGLPEKPRCHQCGYSDSDYVSPENAS